MTIEYSINIPPALADNSTKLVEAVNAWLYQVKAQHATESDKGANAFLANYRGLSWENVPSVTGQSNVASIATKTLPGAGGFGGINFDNGTSTIIHLDATTP